jgi:hypothetical protein
MDTVLSGKKSFYCSGKIVVCIINIVVLVEKYVPAISTGGKVHFMVLGTRQALPNDQVNVLIFILMSFEQCLIIIAVPEALWVMFVC